MDEENKKNLEETDINRMVANATGDGPSNNEVVEEQISNEVTEQVVNDQVTESPVNNEVAEQVADQEISNEPEQSNTSAETTPHNYNNYAENENGGEGKKKNGIVAKIVLSLLGVAVIALIIACALTFGNSKGSKFIGTLTNSNLYKWSDEIQKLSERDGEVESKYTIDTDELIKTLVPTADITIGEIAIITNQVKKGDDLDGEMKLAIADNDVATLKYAVTGDFAGIAVPGLYEKFIGIENKNLKGLAKRFGMSDAYSEAFPDKIDDADVEEINTDLLKIWNKYKGTIAKTISNDITIERNIELDINGEDIKTTKYTFSVNEMNVLVLAKEILKKAKSDEETYNIMRNIAINYLGNDEETLTYENWSETLEEYLEEVNLELEYYEDDEDYEPTEVLAVETYQKGGNTVAIKIILTDEKQEMAYYALNNNNTYYMEFYMDADAEARMYVEFEKENDSIDGKIGIDMKNVYTGDLLEFEIEHKNANAVPEAITANNTIILNTASDRELEELYTEIQENVYEYLLGIIEALPEDLRNEVTNLLMGANYDSNHESDYDYNYDDYDYDYNYDDYDYNYDDYDYNYDDYDYNYDDYDYNYDYNY